MLLFSSSSPKEGKTTTIVNLALTMAESGNRVLLVDADMRKPKIDRIFGLDRDRGLSEVILGNHPWRSCVKTVTDIITGELGMTDIILTPGIDNLISSLRRHSAQSGSSQQRKPGHFIREAGEKRYRAVCAPPFFPPRHAGSDENRRVIFVYAFGRFHAGR